MNIVKSVFHKRWKSLKWPVRFFERINVLTKLKRYGIIKVYTLFGSENIKNWWADRTKSKWLELKLVA
jgi:hypothetical protein